MIVVNSSALTSIAQARKVELDNFVNQVNLLPAQSAAYLDMLAYFTSLKQNYLLLDEEARGLLPNLLEDYITDVTKVLNDANAKLTVPYSFENLNDLIDLINKG